MPKRLTGDKRIERADRLTLSLEIIANESCTHPIVFVVR